MKDVYQTIAARVPALATASLLLAAPNVARAATNVMGNINTDTHWTTAGSPYTLTGDVTVAPQATLTIDPGVTVIAAATDGMASGTSTSKVELIVQGALVANGTASLPIVIKGATSGADGWYGVSFEPGARTSSVTFAQISDTSYALYVRSTNPLTLSDLSVSNANTGLMWRSAMAAEVQRSTFTNFKADGMSFGDGTSAVSVLVSECTAKKAASAGIRLANAVTATVKRSQLLSNATGLVASGGSALTFTNNVVALNSQYGLYLTQAGTSPFTIANSTIDSNVTAPLATGSAGIGVNVHAVTAASAFIVRNCIITNHGTAGLLVEGATSPSHDHNDVWQNGANYQGTTAGIGSLSTNPLYSLPATTGDWSFVSQPVNQTLNDNLSNATVGTFQHSGAVAIRLRFTSMSLERNDDFLNVYDGAGVQLATYNGSYSTTTTPPANGSVIKLAATTDYSNISSFVLAGYEYATEVLFNYRLQASSPVIDKGNDLGAPTEDCDGIARPYDGDVNGTATTDMGAYEWHQNVAPYANAGSDQMVLPSTSVSLDAAGSHDPDGQIVSYDWDFGDSGTHATTAKVSHTYATAGVYTATLTVIDDQGVTGTDTAVITVATNLPPVAQAGADQFVDVAAAVSFDGGASHDPDGTIVGYAWNFGDGSPAGSGLTVSHAYAKAGVFTVTLTVTDNKGATTTDTASVVVGGVTSNQAPIALSGGPYTAAAGTALAIDGHGSSDPDGTITTYAWSFGDGTTTTGSTATHTYAAAGTYLLKLTVTDSGGATTSDTTLVTVNAPANAAPVANAGGSKAAATGVALAFNGSASSDSDGTIASYDWDFGDNSTHGTGATTSHTYAAAGSYLVKLTVRDNSGGTGSDVAIATVNAPSNQLPIGAAGGNRTGQVNQAIAFDGSASSDPDGMIAEYDWDFGDGSTHAATAVATHAYTSAGTYLVRLTVMDNKGESGQDVALVTIAAPAPPANVAPVASAGGSKTAVVGASIAFDGSASKDSDGTIKTYDWDFGDSSTHATTVLATHAYAAAGSYLVRLTVTDDKGSTGQDVALVTIAAPGSSANVAPVASTGGSKTAVVGASIAFDGSASRDSDGTIKAYDWDFGDSSTHGTTVSATHAYAAAGTYLARLTVTDDKGSTGQDIAVVTVAAPGSSANVAPVASAGGSKTGAINANLAFDGSASKDSDGTIKTYDWDFGDSSTHATAVSATHAYAAAGSYLVRLTVTDDKGSTGQDVALVTVAAPGSSANAAPVASAGGSKTGATNANIAFDGSASKDSDGTIKTYDWDFGDSSTHTTTVSATHAYAAAGSYLVRLTVTDDKGSTGQDVVLVTVAAPGSSANVAPVANAGGSKTAAINASVAFDGSASTDSDGTIKTYDWDFGDSSAHATTVSATHAYAAAGSHLVRLTVTDDKGSTGQDVALVTVAAPGSSANIAPVANAGGSKTTAIDATIAFDGGASKDSDGTIETYDWDFGDSSARATGSTAAHAYANAGSYLVRLTVTDNLGAVGSDVVLVTASANPEDAGPGEDSKNQPPLAHAGDSYSAGIKTDITFDGNGSTDPDGSIASYEWTFGDGATGTGATATHSYAHAGSYLVRLKVTDDKGATAEDVAAVNISDDEAPAVNDRKGGCSASAGESSMGGSAWLLIGLGLIAFRRRRGAATAVS